MAQVSDLDIAPSARPPATAPTEVRQWLPRMVACAPELVAAGVAGFCIAPMVLLLAGAFHAPLATALGLLGAGIAMRVCGMSAEPTTRRTVLITAAAALVVLAWFLYNVRYYAEDVYATRDPATYGIAGRWLMDNPSLEIAVHADVFGPPKGSWIEASGFRVVGPDTLNAQGNHLLPVLMALVGSLFGVTALLQANIAISALALFVFFGLARRIVGAALALLVMSALAVSMPFIYVSRDAYSEPLMMLFLLGGLALLHRGITSGRVADYAIAGFVVACAAMVRVDSYLGLLAVVFAAVVAVALAEHAQHRAAVVRAVALVAGGVVPFLLGWLDLTQLSVPYFRHLHHQITLQVLALVALIAVSPAIMWWGWRPALRRKLSSDRTRRRLSLVAVIGLLAAFAFLASRPWWQVTQRSPANPNLENMQRASGVVVDGTRLYNEQSVNWQAMYLGWPTVLLAVAGYAVLVTALVRRRSYALVGTLSTGLIVSALYLWDCQIVADQPWASRRFVPVVIPLLLVAAAAALRALWWWQRSREWGRVLAIVSGVLMVAVPLSISQPVVRVREEAGQLKQLQAICTTVGSHGAVVEVDQSSRAGYGQAIRSYCGVPTIALIGAHASQLATMRAAALADGRILFVLSQDPDTTDYATRGRPAPFSSVRVPRWPNVINKAPLQAWFSTTHVFLSTVDEAGLAHAVPPAR
ncbi:MAG: hypothetical protein DLM58_17450 [Pseudonocardiales bacterium]|nr:MAG: hypothetical protein DLM58_17450 [Pseudonocardiales bacterium]